MQRTCIAILLSMYLTACSVVTPLSNVSNDFILLESPPICEQFEQGEGSWYGPGFHGHRTANGEKYNQNALTAAHPTLPFGTVLEVINTENGKTVRVRINDRGPFVGKRIIDLSHKAALSVDMVKKGKARLELRIVSMGVDKTRKT